MEDIIKDIRKKTDDELAAWLASNTSRRDFVVLAEKEFERRERLEQQKLAQELLAEQHQLDLKLVADQVR